MSSTGAVFSSASERMTRLSSHCAFSGAPHDRSHPPPKPSFQSGSGAHPSSSTSEVSVPAPRSMVRRPPPSMAIVAFRKASVRSAPSIDRA